MDPGRRAAWFRFLIRDWAGQFTEAFDLMLAGAGIKIVKVPQLAGERLCREARAQPGEVTDRMMITGPRHLRAMLDEYVARTGPAWPGHLAQAAQARPHPPGWPSESPRARMMGSAWVCVQPTLGDERGVDMEPCLVLGACNPFLAYQALNTGRRTGLLLSCNVVIGTEANRTVIEALDPQMMVAVAGEPSLQPVADEAVTRLRAASDTLREADRAVPPGAGSPSPACRKGDQRPCQA